MPTEREKEKLYGGYELEDFPPGKSAHIEQLVADKQEESHTLEYKSVGALKDSVNICREVCSFLNSEGGVIIVGVEEEDEGDETGYKRPAKIKGTTEEHSQQWLQDIVAGGVAPSPSFEHFRIHEFPDPGAPSQKQGYVIFVPRSYGAPHQVVKQGVYYKRGWTGCVRMLHYEIMDMVGARQRPRLTIEPEWHNVVQDGAEVSIRLWICVKNTGMAPARSVSIRIINGRGGQPSHRRPQDEWRSLIWKPGRWALAWEPRRAILPGADERMYLDFRISTPEGYDSWCWLQLVGQVYAEKQDPVPFGLYVRGEWRAGEYVAHDEEVERSTIPTDHLLGLESGISLGDGGLAFGSSL